MHLEVILTPTNASHTYVVSLTKVSGTANHTVIADALGGTWGPAWILAEDIGPA
jgi:hypothetical protein